MGLYQTYLDWFPPKTALTTSSFPSQANRVFLITGGYGGVGFETAKALYALSARIYIAGRSEPKGLAAIAAIKTAHPSSIGSLYFLRLDLTDFASVKVAAESFLAKEDRLDIVYHNAGIGGQYTSDSLGPNRPGAFLSTNVLGPFLLQHYLTPLCVATAARSDVRKHATRVLWVSSNEHRSAPAPDGVNWDDMEMRKKGANMQANRQRYRQSKAMNTLLAHEFARRYGEGKGGVISLSLDPGILRTDILRDLRFVQWLCWPFFWPVEKGSLTELFAGLVEIGEGEGRMLEEGGRNGGYVEPWGRWGMMARNVFEGLVKRGTGEKVWRVCEEYVKEYL